MNEAIVTAIIEGIGALVDAYRAHQTGQTIDPAIVLAQVDKLRASIAGNDAAADAAAKAKP